MIEIIIVVISILYVGMFWYPQMSSDYSSSKRQCHEEHMPYTESAKDYAVIAYDNLVINMKHVDRHKLKELAKIYQGTDLGNEIYDYRKKRVLDARVKVQGNIRFIHKKRQLIVDLKKHLETIDDKKLEDITTIDLERLLDKL